MKYQVENIKRTVMADIYDKDVDRRALDVKFTDGKHFIVIRYMILTNYNVAKQIEFDGEEYWGAEVEYHGYRHKPTIKNWREFDRLAQQFINEKGVE